MQPEYDVAISFLQRDEQVALEIQTRLAEQLKVFIYSKHQEELAGTDGLESFRETFLNNARLVVILYRKGWGETPWTRIEQAAVKEKCLNDGWDFLLFVTLHDADELPKWLPKTELRLSFQLYGIDQLVGAIKSRAQKLGSEPRVESPTDRAKRLQMDSSRRAQRQDKLDREGNGAISAEYATVVSSVRSKVVEINEHLTDVPIETGVANGDLTMRARNVSVTTYIYVKYPYTESCIVVQHWKGRLMLPTENGFYRREPKVIGERKYYFDYQLSSGWCWHPENRPSETLQSLGVASELVVSILDLQDRFERGDISWSENEL